MSINLIAAVEGSNRQLGYENELLTTLTYMI
jgi:hypothetical protein